MLKPGRVYFPDFFNGQANLGMHGYDASTPGQQGLFISKGKLESFTEQLDRIELKNIYNIICRYFGMQ